MENRLLYNYLVWYETKIVHIQDQEKSDFNNIPLPSIQNHTLNKKNQISSSKQNIQCLDETKSFPHQISKYKVRHPLSIQKKREIAEAIFKVLLAYSQKYSINATDYVDECFVIKINMKLNNILYLSM